MKKASKKLQDKKASIPPRIISIGRVQIDYTLYLPEEYLMKYDLENMNELEDLKFLKDHRELWGNIQMTTNNNMINSLLYINKVQANKAFVEMIALNGIQFAEKERFMREVLDYVTEHNFLFLLESDILEEAAQMTFTVRIGKRNKTFNVSTEGKKVSNEALSNEDGTVQAIPNIFSKFEKDFENNYNYFLFDLEEFFSVSESNPKILTDFKKFLEEFVAPQKNLRIIINCPDIIKNVNNITLEIIQLIDDFLSFGDIFLFDRKDAHALFIMLNQVNKIAQEVSEKEIQNYLIHGVKYLRPGDKVGVFLDEFNKCNFVEFSTLNQKVSYQNNFEFQQYPKINHTNWKLVEDYKKLIIIYYPLLKAVFLGSFLAKIVHTSKRLSNELYAGFLTGAESSKRVLELMKHKVDMPLKPEFYIIKIAKAKIDREIEKEEMKKKEQKFVLDCINKKSSNLRYYNPLFDDHLNSFFASEITRKQLKEKGFINTNGFIMYDPNYRAVMGASPKRKNFDDVEKEKQLLYAIKSINVHEDPQGKNNLDSFSKMMNSNSPTNMKLPAVQYEYNMSKFPNFNVTQTQPKKQKLKPISEKNVNVNDSVGSGSGSGSGSGNEKKITVTAEEKSVSNVINTSSVAKEEKERKTESSKKEASRSIESSKKEKERKTESSKKEKERKTESSKKEQERQIESSKKEQERKIESSKKEQERKIESSKKEEKDKSNASIVKETKSPKDEFEVQEEKKEDDIEENF